MEIQCNKSSTTAHIKAQTRIQTISESEARSTDPRDSWPELPPVREDFILIG
jgi:hypothetical protein